MAHKPVHPVDTEELHPRTTKLVGAGVLGIFILVLGGVFWWWFSTEPSSTPSRHTPTMTRPSTAENREPETPTATADIRGLNALSTSHNLDVIETDLESTQLESLNTEFGAIESTLTP
jgi:hypothetical protein